MLRADWTIVTAWQKLLLGVALCLPVPALAMSGLALPLPTAVYRVAVAIVESTEGLTRAFTGEDRETHVLAVRKATVTPRSPSPRPVSNPRVASPTRPTRASAPLARGGRMRARSFDAAVTQRSPRTRSSGDVTRTPSTPAGETGAHTSAKTAAGPATHAPTATTQATPAQASASEMRTDPIPRPTDIPPVNTPIPNPAASPLPPPPAPSPPASPPPAPTPQPGLLDPVTKPLEPVTNPVTHTIQPVTDVLQPVTKPLDPILKKTGLGGLLGRP
jgi:hypothetical protein